MKKIIKLVTTVILLLLSLPVLVMAQEVGTLKEEDRIDKNLVYEKSVELSDGLSENETKAENIERGSMKTVAGMSLGLFMSGCPDCFKGYDKLDEDVKDAGLTRIVENKISQLFDNQPRVDVVAHLTNEWVPGYKELGSTVYAAGYKDLADTNITGLWTKTRNIAYLGYVLVMIVVGFMIMFRNKIGGQTMVTIGNSIPRIVISLVLVTFSFAIIGLIIDFGGVIRRVVESIYFSSEGSGIPVHNPLHLVGSFLEKSPTTTVSSTLGIAGIVVMIINAFHPVGLLLSILGLVVLGMVLWGAIKLWITLLKAYFGILVNVVVAPLSILFGSLPGNEGSIMNIFKSALRNVLVFPLAFAIVNLPYVLEKESVSLVFPESLVGTSTSETEFLPNLLIQLAKVVAIYAAATAPDMLKAIIPSTASKSSEGIAEAVKGGISKVPFLGGMFK